MTRFDTVSLLTDYGTDDEFVGVVKCVLRDLAPHVTTIDLTHGVPPHNVTSGALALARSIAYVPSGVILAIVDPGVGTDRRAIAVEVAGGEGVLIGPDNGLLAPAVAMAGGAERAVELTNPEFQLQAPGATFAGRDVFAPAAAHICNGVELEELGQLIDPIGLLPGTMPLPQQEGDTVVAEVLWIDRFGNCQLNVNPDDLPESWGDQFSLEFPETRTTRHARRVHAFGQLAKGEVGLLVDSYGMFAVVVDQHSAADELHITNHARVNISKSDAPAPRPAPPTIPVSLGVRPDEPQA